MRQNRNKAKPNYVLVQLNENGIASLVLNRPDCANAFNAEVIAQLITHLDTLSSDPRVRGLILAGQGKHFSAGADIDWMRSMATKGQQKNQLDAYQLATLLEKLDRFPHPTVAVVQGSAFGGALGLICCCDMVIASDNAAFCLSEVRLGLVPATIAPYVIRAMGVRNARRYMLSAERINAETACRLNIVHQISHSDNLQNQALTWLTPLLAHSPHALVEAKKLCHHCHHSPIDESMKSYTSELIADIRVSPQGQEGLSAFLQKRAPNWNNLSSGEKK
ncbi:enoyl-CoA hydratase-related protein [Vibrio bivalvicida]|uniref:Gamma-carboxygeranoyl-CoA hydratase n=1 Tax=Vibrio bivalvicida TaxID=1276888 RepID=A0A177XVL8_9VIBR|nr:enoyl-CoA hydratase-related protein [Vibrio bivalvicida]OAJ92678.1 gamma-carboxygeranoyl-CoA hydratase [Vibrio bivalvicida]